MSALEALSTRDEDAPLETRVVRVRNEGGPVADPGTQLLTALNEAAAEAPADRLAGAILITDGQVHDPDAVTEFPGPVHALITGEEGEIDRRLVVISAPSFGIVGEDSTFRVKVEGVPGTARIAISVDGEVVEERNVTVGAENDINVPITHGGSNVVELVVREIPDELTLRNNRAAITVNGVRDRLRVLLVSGEPHAGERTWRNLLKADPSVDLVHFTILRPPTKQDGTPVFELSLIAFPTRELFLEKVDDFDLIVFDRYRRRGVLPSPYIANISRYVSDGGAVILAVVELPLVSPAPDMPDSAASVCVHNGYRCTTCFASDSVTDFALVHPLHVAMLMTQHLTLFLEFQVLVNPRLLLCRFLGNRFRGVGLLTGCCIGGLLLRIHCRPPMLQEGHGVLHPEGI